VDAHGVTRLVAGVAACQERLMLTGALVLLTVGACWLAVRCLTAVAGDGTAARALAVAVQVLLVSIGAREALTVAEAPWWVSGLLAAAGLFSLGLGMLTAASLAVAQRGRRVRVGVRRAAPVSR